MTKPDERIVALTFELLREGPSGCEQIQFSDVPHIYGDWRKGDREVQLESWPSYVDVTCRQNVTVPGREAADRVSGRSQLRYTELGLKQLHGIFAWLEEG